MLIVLSGPSGVGKGTVRQALVKKYGEQFKYSVSMTTRQPRPGEQDGQDYYFRTQAKFQHEIETGGMLEYAQYVGNYYGTPLKYVNQTLDAGYDVFLEIEVNGAMQVRSKAADGVFIFLTPPDLASLKDRIVKRGTDSETAIEERLKTARRELNLMNNYDYAVVNDQVDLAVERIKTIITAEHLKVSRVMERYQKMIGVE